jgi:hypothetical protein
METDIKKYISRTDLCSVSKYERLLNMLQSRLVAFEERDVRGSKAAEQYSEIHRQLQIFDNVYSNSKNLWLVEKAYKVIYNRFVHKFGLSSKGHLESLGYYKSKYVDNGSAFGLFVKGLEISGKKNRAREWNYRLKEELHQAHKNGWFIIFNTLTVRPEEYRKVFADGKCWKNYIQRFDRLIDGVHRYFAVQERGSRGRLHLHAVHVCEKLPKGCVDPNRGLIKPSKRELSPLKKLWPHGYSAPIAVRYGSNDAYSKRLWRWPCKEDGQPIDGNGIECVANYVTKYVTKTTELKDTKWKIKATQNLGLMMLIKKLKMLRKNHLKCLVVMSSQDCLKIRGKKVPVNLVRIQALKVLDGKMSIRNLKLSLKLEKMTRPGFRELKSLIQKLTTSKCQNSGVFLKMMEFFDRSCGLRSDQYYSILDEIRSLWYEKMPLKRQVTAASLVAA